VREGGHSFEGGPQYFLTEGRQFQHTNHMFPIALPRMDYAEQLRRQDAAVRNFAVAAEHFLRKAYPHVDANWITNLSDAFVGWICCGTTEQLQALDEQKAALELQSIVYPGVDNTDMLVQLTGERDQITEQIEMAEKAKLEFPVEGLANMVEATMVMPLRRRLESWTNRSARYSNSWKPGLTL
jgi:hypothetical protein